MNRILTRLLLSSSLALPLTALATDFTAPTKPTGKANYKTIVGTVLDSVWLLFSALAIIMLVWAGILYLTAAGDPEKTGKAKNATIYGVIGIIVAILAFSASRLLGQIIGI